MDASKRTLLVGIILVAGILVGSATSILAVSSNNVTTLNQWTAVADCAFLIFNDSTTTYAKHCDSGQISYSGTDSKTVITSALGALTPGRDWKERIVIKGNYTIDNSASALTIPDYTIFELHGKFKALDKTMTMVSIGNYNELVGGVYDGNRAGTNGGDTPVRVILSSGKDHVRLENLKVINGYSRGIEVDTANDTDIVLDRVYTENSWRNIMVWTHPDNLATATASVSISNSFAYNAVDDNIDLSTVRVSLSNVHAYGAGVAGKDIIADGFREIQMDGIHADGVQAIASSLISNVERVQISDAFVKSIYMSFVPAVNSIMLDNIHSKGSTGHGIQIRVNNNTADDVILSNIIVDAPTTDGLVLISDGTGSFNKVVLNGIITRNIPGGNQGIDIANANYVLHDTAFFSGNNVNFNLSKRSPVFSTAIVDSGTTSEVVTHFLPTTPKLVIIAPTSDFQNIDCWVSAKASATFTITCESAPAQNITFDWAAWVTQ